MDRLNQAAKEAWRGVCKGEGGPFGAVIVKGTRLLAIAHNTVLLSKDATCHAEINAIRMASRKLKSPFLKGCVIYSTTEPCPMCFAAIHWAQISRIVSSTTIADVKKIGFNELSISNRLLKKTGHSLVKIEKKKNKACLDLLESYAALPNRLLY